MKTFRDHLKEEVKLDSLYTGGIDIDRDAVRDEINGILSAVAAKPCVTPYNTLNKVRKALAYFSIHLPKRVYMEGKHGVEVWEIHQFGDKMGMTDQGEFIKSTPCKYYLFFHYHLMGSMYFVEAKIVDGDELEKKMDMTERMFAEGVDAACRQGVAKAMAPKEPMHDEDEGTESTKKAVEVSMRRKDKKLSADKLDELKQATLKAYKSAAKADRNMSKEVVKKGLDIEGKFKHAIKKRKKGLERVSDRLDEVSKDTLKSYIKKAGKSKVAHSQSLDNLSDVTNQFNSATAREMKKGRSHLRKMRNRRVGIDRAMNRLEEKAPPGAKFERMVKHIKKGYSKDGLTAKEKGIAYATAWKAKKKEQSED